MANKISVIIDVTVDKANRALSGFRKSVSEADGAVGKFKAGAASAGASLKANIMPVAAAAGVAIVAFAAKSVAAASDLEESTNAVQVSFGKAAEGVLEIGEGAAESMGLSKAAFNEAAVGFAAFTETIAGPGGDVAATLGELTGRASDFASVMNLEVSEAANVFRSALAGETEPIKKFGIDLSAASVEAYALANGLVKSKGEMTEAIKVQARYGLLMEKTTKFAGDFANTSGDLANATRIAKARITDFQAEIGQQLIPTVAAAVNVAMDLADAMEKVKLSGGGMGETMSQNRGVLDTFTNAVENSLNPMQSLMQGYNEISGLLDAVTGSTDRAAEATKKAEQYTKDATKAHLENQRGLEQYQRQLSEDAHVKAHLEHTAGMIRESKRMADKMAADIQRIEDKYTSFYDEISNDDALLDLQDGWEGMAEAGVKAWETAIAGADDAEQASRDYQREINRQKGRILDFITALGNVPPETTAELLALVDEGYAQAAERRLNAIAAGRTVNFRAQVSGTEFVRDQLRRAGQPDVKGATGGIVTRPTMSLIGEAGPEAVIPLNKTPGSSPLPKGGLGANTINLTVNAGLGTDGRDVGRLIVEELQKYQRRNGPGSLP